MSQTVHAGLRNCELLCTCRKCPLLKRKCYIYGTILMCMMFSSKWNCFILSAVEESLIFYVVCCRLWIWLKKLDTSTSQTPLLTSIFAPWTEVLSESSRVTWKPRDCPEAPPTAGLTFPHGLQIDCLFLFLFSFFFLTLECFFLRLSILVDPVAACSACQTGLNLPKKHGPQRQAGLSSAILMRISLCKHYFIYRKEVEPGNFH